LTKFNLKNIFSDIKFWIILFGILRLYGITNPPIEVAHNWRQTTVCMAARNFYTTDPNIFYPRVDIAGEKSGITGMEFPIFNYLIYVFSLVFGYDHWYGRLINLLISSIGVFFFYKLLLKYFEKKIAFNAAIILLASFWFAYSRKIMPDTFASSLVIISLYYGTNYLEGRNPISNLILYFIFGLFGVLSKLPVVYIWFLYSIWIFSGGNYLRKAIFIGASSVIAGITFFWYYIWVPYLVDEFGLWYFFMGKNLSQGFNESIKYLPEILNHFYETAIRYVGFSMLLFGLITSIIKKDKIIWITFLISLIFFSLIIFKSGKTFAFHSYYVLPFVPVMALVASYGMSQIKNSTLVKIILFAICIEGVLNQWNDFVIKPNEKEIIRLESSLDSISNQDDLIVINSGEYPTPMYFANRKGWVCDNSKLFDKNYISHLKNHGCKYIVILKKSFGSDIRLNYNVLIDNEYFKVYELK